MKFNLHFIFEIILFVALFIKTWQFLYWATDCPIDFLDINHWNILVFSGAVMLGLLTLYVVIVEFFVLSCFLHFVKGVKHGSSNLNFFTQDGKGT